MPAELVLQLANWDPSSSDLSADPVHRCKVFTVDGISEAVRVLICESQPGGAGGSALYQELASMLAQHPLVACSGPSWPRCRTHINPRCRQILVLILGPATVPGLDHWVQANWSQVFGNQATVLPIAPFASTGRPRPGAHIQSWQIAFWATGPREKAVDVLRLAGIGPRKAIFISYVRGDSSPLADELWESLGKLGFDVFLDRFTATLGQRFADEIAERVATAEAVVLLRSSNYQQSRWVRRELAVARLVGTGVLAITEHGAKPPRSLQADDLLAQPATVWKQPTAKEVDEITRFIARRSALAALRARVYCERTLRHAAGANGLAVGAIAPGVFDVGGVAIAPVGQPPTLADLHASSLARQGRTLAMLGETPMLRPSVRVPIEWVANTNAIVLRRRADTNALMVNIRNTGRP
jgi:hypothetical protein